MSTLNVENIKHIAADSDSLRLATDGTVSFTKNVTAVTVDSATITNLSGTNVTGTNVTADSATITNLSGTNVTADSATVTNLSGTNVTADSATVTTISSTNVTASGDIKGSSFNGGQLGGRRNIIINGAMQVAQRGGGTTSITNGVDGLDYYSADRMKNYISYGNGDITYASVTTDGNSFKPAFQNSVKYSNLTGGAPTGSQQVALLHYIEGQDLQHLEYSTSNAKTLTLSFWVKTNKTGVYSVEFFTQPTSGSSRGYTKTFTVSSTNWEYYTLTVEGDTASDIRNSNDYGLLVKFWLAAGGNFTSGTLQTSWQDRVAGNAVSSSNVNLADDINNVFEITGLQLEVGDTATPFEHRSYGEELALCQRYYEIVGMTMTTSGQFDNAVSYAVTKRAVPTLSVFSGSLGTATVLAMPNNDVGQIRQQTNASGAVDVAIQANAELQG